MRVMQEELRIEKEEKLIEKEFSNKKKRK